MHRALVWKLSVISMTWNVPSSSFRCHQSPLYASATALRQKVEGLCTRTSLLPPGHARSGSCELSWGYARNLCAAGAHYICTYSKVILCKWPIVGAKGARWGGKRCEKTNKERRRSSLQKSIDPLACWPKRSSFLSTIHAARPLKTLFSPASRSVAKRQGILTTS